MEDFTRYFMGEPLGNLTINGWKWLWGMPSRSPETTKTSDDLILEDITRSLAEMRSKLDEIQGIVERVRLVAQEIQHQYHLKCERYQELIGISLESNRQGNILAARSAMAQSIQLERVLSELKERSEVSQGMSIYIQEIYVQKTADLELLEIDLKMSKTQREVNDSIGIDRSPDLIVLQEKLEKVRTEIEDRYHQIQVEIQLSYSSNCKLGNPLNNDDIDAQIEQRKNIEDRAKN